MLAQSLLYWRLRKGWTQQRLAQRSGIPQSMISLIERGRKLNITLSTLTKLAHALQVEQQQLMTAPPREALPLSPFTRAGVAHAIVWATKPPRGVSPQVVRDIAGVISQKLRMFGVPGAAVNHGRRWRVQRRWREVQVRYGDQLVQDILHRVDKELYRAGHDRLRGMKHASPS